MAFGGEKVLKCKETGEETGEEAGEEWVKIWSWFDMKFPPWG